MFEIHPIIALVPTFSFIISISFFSPVLWLCFGGSVSYGFRDSVYENQRPA